MFTIDITILSAISITLGIIWVFIVDCVLLSGIKGEYSPIKELVRGMFGWPLGAAMICFYLSKTLIVSCLLTLKWFSILFSARLDASILTPEFIELIIRTNDLNREIIRKTEAISEHQGGRG